ncbi:nucleosome assembly protein [Ramicandelaber brevisporus]|nr:nucleosome assembly protein [Ramicandelaber brevisporus]
MADIEETIELAPEVLRRVIALKSLQREQHTVEAELHKETLALELKYAKLYAPIQAKINAIINGEREPTTEEVTAGTAAHSEDLEEDEEPYKDNGEVSAENIKGIPDFWLTVLTSHPLLENLIQEQDDDALKSLRNIEVEEVEGKTSFKLIFTFASNEFFENEKLTKTINYKPDPNGGFLTIDSTDGTVVNWKEGKNLTVKTETRKQRHRTTNQVRTIVKTVPADSFFNFFRTIEPVAEDDESEEAETNLNNLLEDDEVADVIKDRVVPHAVDWFTGKALEYDIDDNFDDEDDGDYDDDEEEDDEDEDDDDLE